MSPRFLRSGSGIVSYEASERNTWPRHIGTRFVGHLAADAGVVTFGLVYGVAARAVGLSPAETAGMSALMPLLSRELPRPVFRWLQLVPVAILSALIAPAVFVVERRVALGPQSPAAVVGAAVAWRTRSVLLTIVAGMLTYWLISALL